MAANKTPAGISQKVKEAGSCLSGGRKQADGTQLKFTVCMCVSLFMFMCFGGRKAQIVDDYCIRI